MVRKILIVATLLTVASPLAAQEDYVWTSKRPDGHAPIGMSGARTLERGALQFTYRFSQLNSKGVWLDNDSIPLATTLDFYDQAPLTLTNQTHSLSVSYGVTQELTFVAAVDYSSRQREQQTTGGVFYVTESQSLGDVTVSGLYNFLNLGAYKAHLQMGARIPTGQIDIFAETPFSSPNTQGMPYDMRPGAGTFALLPGMTVQTQNEVASLGGQITGMIPVGTNDRSYSLGNSFRASGWAAYMLSDYMSASARIQWENWGGIEGGDPNLDPDQDPGNDGFFLEGERVDMHVGVNFYLPEGSRFAGHRLSIETIFPISHEYAGPQFGLDWGVIIGWQVVF